MPLSIQSELRRPGATDPDDRPSRPAAAWLLAMAVLLLPRVAPASQLLAPSVGAPDSARNGATVATPLTAPAAAFSNPAGLAALEPGSASFTLGLPVGHSRVAATAPPGYRSTSEFVGYAPEGGAVYEFDSGLRWGFAMYGSLGSVFDSDADPSVGLTTDFYSSSAVTNAALMAAWPITDRLSIGASLVLLYGQLHLRYFQDKQFANTVRGAGTQASFGMRYEVTDRVALGVSYRTPGKLWTSGDDRLPSGAKQDVEVDLDIPAQVFVGLNADVTDRLHVGVAGRWTDSSTFGDSIFRFESTPAANIPYIRSASDEWRVSAGFGFDCTDTLTLSFGAGWADEIVPDTWVSPLVMDSAEWKITGGLSWQLPEGLEDWTLDLTIGQSPDGARNVSQAEAAVLPGRYKIGGGIYMIGLRTNL